VQSRAPLAIEDAGADERLLAGDPVLASGYRGFLGVPLAAPEGALHGVLAVYSMRPKAWREEEVEALVALAANASTALSNAELYQRVALEQERSSAILASVADGIVAVDAEGRVVLWNRAAEEITGVPSAEAYGQLLVETLGRDLGEEASGSRPVAVLRGGEEVWLSVLEAVMRDSSGAVSGRVYAIRDISADRLVEELKSEFVSTVSQELRRPLTSIYGFAQTLLRKDVDFAAEERRVFLGYIASESERLAAIVDALLSVARLDSGELQVQLAPTDVGAVVQEVVAGARSSADGAGVDFVVDLPEEALAARVDRDKLRQVLGILLENAVKFSPGGGTVTVAARPRADAVEVRVSDEGIGIPHAEQERIFRKFYRGDSATSRGTTGGTGLGLFIVQSLVSAMGGRVSVSSKEGEGSTFGLELPLADAPDPEVVRGPELERV
jgi:two-component system phosphate regulon sensor histidine kinase PhoR